jgi:hypothetical protein
MSTPDKPTQRGRHGVTFRYGVWVARDGLRREVVRDGEVWRIYAYMSLTGGRPERVSEYTNQAALVNAIADLEAQGYQYDPDRRPHENRARPGAVAATRWRSQRIVIGTALLCVLLLAIEFVVLRR